MKHLLIIPLLFTLFACSVDQDLPEPIECTIGHLGEPLATNIHFIRDTDADTIHFSYINQEGQHIAGRWIDGVIDWDCIGFSLRNESFDLTISADGETCVLVIPPLNQ